MQGNRAELRMGSCPSELRGVRAEADFVLVTWWVEEGYMAGECSS
jgi:hypothetical protein